MAFILEMMCSHVLKETYCVMLCVKYVLCSYISSVFVLPLIRLVGFHGFVQLLEQRHLNLQIRTSDTQEFFFFFYEYAQEHSNAAVKNLGATA